MRSSDRPHVAREGKDWRVYHNRDERRVIGQPLPSFAEAMRFAVALARLRIARAGGASV